MLKDNVKLKVLSRVVAHLMGDGCVTNRYFAYYNKNEALLKNFERDVYSIFKIKHFIKGKTNSGTKLVQIQNKPVLVFLRSLVKDYRSFSLSVPNFIKNRDLKKEFLTALYDDEGCVALRVFRKTNEIKRSLTLSSNSLILIEEIKPILKDDFGVSSNKISKNIRKRNEKVFINYVLSITGKENFIKFRKEIGFAHPDKIIRLDLMINSYIRK